MKILQVKNLLIIICFFFILFSATNSYSQINFSGDSVDKCGYSEELALEALRMQGDHWGYGYDSLLVDLESWRQSPYVTIDSLGASVQGRAIWQLMISDEYSSSQPKRTVMIHARTHPGEVQGWWVTDELIQLLISEDAFSRFMRDNCTFYIIPMYNPDGVELEYPRENANRIDIESNWDKNPVQPEVDVLRNRFLDLMSSEAPIEIALNMHSAYACKRYFVYHDAVGTSVDFTSLEQNFINWVRMNFLEGIEPWHYFISWTSGTPLRYPESWFWTNHGESVMALTYEDMNCSSAGEYDKTAFSLLRGIATYLGLDITAVEEAVSEEIQGFTLFQNYPNPVAASRSSLASTKIQYNLKTAQNVRLVIYDILGRQVQVLDEGHRMPNFYQVDFDISALANGIYFYQLQTPGGVLTKHLLVTK